MLLNDGIFFYRISKPTKCEIWALFNSAEEYRKLMDPMLKHAYKSLPPLRFVQCLDIREVGSKLILTIFFYSSCTLTTWRSDNEDTGFIMWGSWKHQLQNRNME